MIWPRKPNLPADVEAIFKQHGVDGLRQVLSRYEMDWTDPERSVLIGKNRQAARGDVENWLRWKAEVDALWIKVGVMLALIAALAAIGGAVEGWIALR